MEGMMENYEDQEERMRRRRQERLERMRREKRRQQMIRKTLLRVGVPAVAAVVVLVVAVSILVPGGNHAAETERKAETTGETADTQIETTGTQSQPEAVGTFSDNVQAVIRETVAENKVYEAGSNAETVTLGGELVSENAILINMDTGTVLAKKAENQRISPASMTKVLTVLVAAEHVTDLDDTFTITTDITDYSYVNDCSNVGFAKDETVTVRDLFYGTVLPSGADAAAGLATYVAGDLDTFVEMMNQKLDELGLSDTAHFTNCVGLYDEDHYCTVYDMAMIMEAAMDNELCREVLSAHKYTTSATPEHPEGIEISNWFLRRIEDKDAGGEVLCAKTGYVVQSKNCAVSYAKDASGEEYICVTVGATSAWRCIYDHVDIYKQFLG